MKNKIILVAAISMLMTTNIFAGSTDMGSLDMGSMDMGSFDMGDMSMPSMDTSSFNMDTSDFGSSMSDMEIPKEFSSDFAKGAQTDMSSLSSSFGDMSLDTSGKMDMDMKIDSSSLSSQLKDVQMPETPNLEMPNLDSMTTEMAESMKQNASSTLRSYMGTNFTDLGSSLYSMEKMPEVNMETLNVKYAGLLDGLEKEGYGTDYKLTQPTMVEGYATSAQEQFEKTYGGYNLPTGPKEYTMPSVDPSKLIDETLNKRGKSIADSRLEDSAVYKLANEKLSTSGGVEQAKKKVNDASNKVNANKNNKNNTKNNKNSNSKKTTSKKGGSKKKK